MSYKTNIIVENGTEYYIGCKDGGRRTLASHARKNSKRMWVNSRYIPTSHPLHKPGRYKTFEDAAFSSLEKYESSTEGQV